MIRSSVWVRAGVLIAVAATVSAAVATACGLLAELVFGMPIDMTLLAALAGACSVSVLLSVGCPGDSANNRLLEKMAGEIDHIMIGAAETSHFVDSIKKKIEQDVHAANEIVANSHHNAEVTRQIAANAQRASKAAADVRDESTAGGIEVDRGLREINEAQAEAQAASDTMAALQQKSRRIQAISDLITEIASNTNLLALNAAIEAARAGEHGRGFAVVAGEVKRLAQRTQDATADITAMVDEIINESERAAAGMTALTGKVTEAAQNVQRVHCFLAKIEQLAGASEQEIQQIADASRAHVDTTAVITEAISRIRDNMLSTEAELPRATDSAMQLAGRAESLFEALAYSSVQTGHDQVRRTAETAAKEIERIFADAITRGEITEEDLFDRNYVEIPRTNPPKYTTRFDNFTDRVLPALQERILEQMPSLAYAGAVDSNGYFPTHNRKFSQPLTGNYDKDLVNNRTKRIFNDRTGSRCGSNTKPFLLQTYKRDTGEVMHDLSVPILVGGKHWGGFRIGYKSASPLGQETPAPAPQVVQARKLALVH